MVQDSLSVHETAVRSQHTACTPARSPQTHDTAHLFNKLSWIPAGDSFFSSPPRAKGKLTDTFHVLGCRERHTGTLKHIKWLDFSSPTTPPPFFQKKGSLPIPKTDQKSRVHVNSISEHWIHLRLWTPVHGTEVTVPSQQQSPAPVPTPLAGTKKKFNLEIQEQEHPLREETQTRTDARAIPPALLTAFSCLYQQLIGFQLRVEKEAASDSHCQQCYVFLIYLGSSEQSQIGKLQQLPPLLWSGDTRGSDGNLSGAAMNSPSYGGQPGRTATGHWLQLIFQTITVNENYWKASSLFKKPNKSLTKVNSASQFMKCFYPTTEEWLCCCIRVSVPSARSGDFRQTVSGL